jgi:hypothetical protein
MQRNKEEFQHIAEFDMLLEGKAAFFDQRNHLFKRDKLLIINILNICSMEESCRGSACREKVAIAVPKEELL